MKPCNKIDRRLLMERYGWPVLAWLLTSLGLSACSFDHAANVTIPPGDTQTSNVAVSVSDQSFTTKGTPRLLIDSSLGSVEITGEAGAHSIQLKVTRSVYPGEGQSAEELAANLKVASTQTGDQLQISTQRTDKTGANLRSQLSLQIGVPVETILQVNAQNGAVKASQLQSSATQTFSLSSGTLSLSQIKLDSLVASVSQGTLDMYSVQATHLFNLQVNQGDISGTALATTGLEVKAESGNVALQGDFKPGIESHISTHQGSIDLGLSAGSTLKLEATSDTGAIAVDLPGFNYGLRQPKKVTGGYGSNQTNLYLNAVLGEIKVHAA